MSRFAHLADRALVRVGGPEARAFLNRLLTQEVETLEPGELRLGALLTPQGRLLYELFLFAEADGVVIDVAADARAALVLRLNAYRLRAAVEITAVEGGVFALWDAQDAPTVWRHDPRHPAAGWRAIGEATPPPGAVDIGETAYRAHRFGLGLVDAVADGLSDRAYATEANLDLTHGVDFSKGCFVGQETTSRMKRRGGMRSRVLPLRAPGARPGDVVSAGALRAGEVVAAEGEQALALLRLDRIAGGLTLEDRPVTPHIPPGWEAAVAPPSPSILETTP